MVSEADPAAIRTLPRVFQTRLACGMDAHTIAVVVLGVAFCTCTCIAAAAPLHVAQMRTLKIALHRSPRPVPESRRHRRSRGRRCRRP